MGGQARQRTLSAMVCEELPIVVAETTVVKKTISKALARTEATAAKKKPAKKAKKAAKKPKKAKKAKAKKPKKKKKKKKKAAKKKKKKAKKIKYVPGKGRAKGVHKSKALVAASKKTAAAMKKKGTGIFKPVTLSKDLSAICGMTKGTRGAVFKALWAYIKKKGLSKGKTVSKIPGIFAGGSMFKLPGAVSKHLK